MIGAHARPRPGHRLPLAERPHARLRLRRAQGRSAARREAPPPGTAGDQLLRRGAARLPAVHARVAGARLRGRRQPRPRRARALARPGRWPGGPAARRIVKDASRPGDRHRASRRPERDGRDVYLTLDHTIQANAEAVLRDTVLARGTRRARPRSCSTRRRARVLAMAIAPGFDANRLPAGLARAAAQPRRHRHVRAGLDVQARHGRRRALRGARHAERRASRCRTRSRSPTASSTTPSRAGPRR